VGGREERGRERYAEREGREEGERERIGGYIKTGAGACQVLRCTQCISVRPTRGERERRRTKERRRQIERKREREKEGRPREQRSLRKSKIGSAGGSY